MKFFGSTAPLMLRDLARLIFLSFIIHTSSFIIHINLPVKSYRVLVLNFLIGQGAIRELQEINYAS